MPRIVQSRVCRESLSREFSLRDTKIAMVPSGLRRGGKVKEVKSLGIFGQMREFFRKNQSQKDLYIFCWWRFWRVEEQIRYSSGQLCCLDESSFVRSKEYLLQLFTDLTGGTTFQDILSGKWGIHWSHEAQQTSHSLLSTLPAWWSVMIFVLERRLYHFDVPVA